MEPGERHIGICDVPGIEVGDRVVATLNPITPRQGSFCFAVVDSEDRSSEVVGGDLRVLTTFNNEQQVVIMKFKELSILTKEFDINR